MPSEGSFRLKAVDEKAKRMVKSIRKQSEKVVHTKGESVKFFVSV